MKSKGFDFKEYKEIINKIKEQLKYKDSFVLGIDGMAAAGKSTLAELFCKELGAQVIHIDDFYLPLHMRTQNRMSEIAGNIHFERLKEEVIINLEALINNEKKYFFYNRYNCKTNSQTDCVKIQNSKLYIIEGAYSLHPSINKIYDYRIFMKIDNKEQISRIIARNGEKEARLFQDNWIPAENKYFIEYKIEETANIVVGIV